MEDARRQYHDAKGGGQFLIRHLKSTIADYGYDQLITKRHLRDSPSATCRTLAPFIGRIQSRSTQRSRTTWGKW